MMYLHKPVLLAEVLESLNIQTGKKYIDATFGGGGHSEGIINRGGLVLGIDQDEDAVSHARENTKLKVFSENFRNIKRIAVKNGFTDVSGILFDLGVSSYQLDSDTRGFSIRRNAPLDMRMDLKSKVKASDIVNSYSEENLVDIFQRFGEEEKAREAAQEIIKARKIKKIETTGELVSTLAFTLNRHGMVHPATKIFQALRIEVNNEIEALKEGLTGALDLLGEKGRVVVISFHSLEDRIVKQTFSNWERNKLGIAINRKPITASDIEVRSNPRARSAKLRTFQKN